jgi:hypothetical protein
MSQGWCAKGIEKNKRNGQRRNGNTFKPLMNRNSSTYAEKAQALKAYKHLLRREDASENFIPCVVAAIFDGTGLPNEGYDFGETPAKKFAGKVSKGSVVVSAPVTLVKSWNRRNGFAGKS